MSAAARRKLSRLLKEGWAEGKMKPRAKAKPAKASTGGLVTFSLASVLRQCYLVQPRAGSRKSCISQQACRDLDANLAEAHAVMGWIKTLLRLGLGGSGCLLPAGTGRGAGKRHRCPGRCRAGCSPGPLCEIVSLRSQGFSWRNIAEQVKLPSGLCFVLETRDAIKVSVA